uniref:OsmC family protein n=1 Tax=Skermanella mucosa TaxID=1789672 RepID=UPI003899838B
MMAERTAEAEWRGALKDGTGRIRTGSGVVDSAYSFPSRFESGSGTNPEELIAAAHAGCFSMALAHGLAGAGHPAERVSTTAKVHLEKADGGFRISRIDLICEAEVPGIDEAGFRKQADDAKANCPVSKALAATEITLDARLA